jgi:hypothetical protein
MKQWISILLLLAFISPPCISFLMLTFQKHTIKEQVKERILSNIDKSELVTFTFSSYEVEKVLEWEHSKEFEYKGQMYDVVEQHPVSKDSIRYICWWDKAETELNLKLYSMVENLLNSNPDKQKNDVLLLDFYKNLYHEAFRIESLNNGIYDHSKTRFYYVNHMKSAFTSSVYPPPELG